MAHQKREDKEASLIKKTVKASISGFKKFIVGTEMDRTVEEIKEEVEQTIKLTREKLDLFLEKVTTRTIGVLLLVAGIVFGFLGIGYFLIDYFRIPRSMTWMIVGLIILIIAWISVKRKP